jgi:hypothetical protein
MVTLFLELMPLERLVLGVCSAKRGLAECGGRGLAIREQGEVLKKGGS